MHLAKFAQALRLRWLWFEWTDRGKAWIGLGSPCDAEDLDLFYAATSITIGDGATADFWEASWLSGQRPKQMAPHIYSISRRKKWTVQQALANHRWIGQVDIARITSASDIQEFALLWYQIQAVHLNPSSPDSIVWKFTDSGTYTASSAYKIQFEGIVASPMQHIICKVWAAPKCKFFAWLIYQNRVLDSGPPPKAGLAQFHPLPPLQAGERNGGALDFQMSVFSSYLDFYTGLARSHTFKHLSLGCFRLD